jgi:hypothetical protein
MRNVKLHEEEEEYDVDICLSQLNVYEVMGRIGRQEDVVTDTHSDWPSTLSCIFF